MLHALSLALLQVPAIPASTVPRSNRFGAAVASAGDVNEDGVPDLWVGDPLGSAPTEPSAGRAWCVSGKDGSTLLCISAPPGSREYGWTLAGLGDVDGDGVRDVAVGCMQADARDAESDKSAFASSESAVHVHSGRDGALKVVVRGAGEQLKFGWYSSGAGPALANVGDWNEDGADDLAIGWSYADGDLQDQGRVQVVSGRDGSTLHEWLGLEHHDRFGFALARVADVDGDGRGELAASAVPDQDGRSPSDALQRTRSGYVRLLSSKNGTLRTIHAVDGSRFFGFSLAAFPRNAGGGVDGVIVGQAHDWNASYVVTRWNLSDGSKAQLATRPPLTAWDGGSEYSNSIFPPRTEVDVSFATCVLAVPDRDGDGQADVLVTEPQAFCGIPAGVISSKPSKPSRASDSLAAVPLGRVELGDLGVEYSHVGIACCTTGDVDGDGVEDFVVSGCSIRYPGCTGTVNVVSGKTLKLLSTYTRPGRE